MSSFYGTNIITHIPRSNFEISHIYPNAVKMHQTIKEDKVPIYGYVIVDYNHPNGDFQDDGQTGLYQFNNQIDQLKWGSDTLIINYDQTVWQKLLDYNDQLVYRAITRLNSILPNFKGPADYFNKEQSLVTFQRLNAIPVFQRDIPKTYEAFGITELNEEIISFDQQMADTFNTRYPTPRNELPIEMHENHQLSKDNSSVFSNKIQQKITDIRDSITETQDVIKQERNNINNYQVNITSARNLIDEYNSEIKQQNTLNEQNILTLSNYYEDLVYYTEMDTWYHDVFLPQAKLIANNLPEKLFKFNSNTLEYPTK